jgi:hypothetical protein
LLLILLSRRFQGVFVNPRASFACAGFWAGAGIQAQLNCAGNQLRELLEVFKIARSVPRGRHVIALVLLATLQRGAAHSSGVAASGGLELAELVLRTYRDDMLQKEMPTDGKVPGDLGIARGSQVTVRYPCAVSSGRATLASASLRLCTCLCDQCLCCVTGI